MDKKILLIIIIPLLVLLWGCPTRDHGPEFIDKEIVSEIISIDSIGGNKKIILSGEHYYHYIDFTADEKQMIFVRSDIKANSF